MRAAITTPAADAALPAEDPAHDSVMRVYVRARRQLHAVAARYVGGDAEDIVQDAFLNALRSRAGFRGAATPLTWLHRIVVNVALSHCRRRSRRDHVYSRQATVTLTAPAVSEDALAIRAALRELPPEQLRAFVMYDLLGHTHAEIARQLAIPLGTSKSRLSDARKRLRSRLVGPTRLSRTA